MKILDIGLFFETITWKHYCCFNRTPPPPLVLKQFVIIIRTEITFMVWNNEGCTWMDSTVFRQMIKHPCIQIYNIFFWDSKQLTTSKSCSIFHFDIHTSIQNSTWSPLAVPYYIAPSKWTTQTTYKCLEQLLRKLPEIQKHQLIYFKLYLLTFFPENIKYATLN